MSQSIADLISVGGTNAGIRIWLKSSAYTRRLLLGELGDPWESAGKYLAYFSQTQGLLKPDVAVLEVGDLFDSWLQRNPGVRLELAGKRKLSYPLKKLLEQSQPRELLAEIIYATLAHLCGQTSLILAMPSPRYWLQQANHAAGREAAALDEGSIEDAAMYMADLIRSISNLAVGGILFEEPQAESHMGPANFELYRPIINVAKHYRWPIAVRLGNDNVVQNAALTDIDVLIGLPSLQSPMSATGVDVSQVFWADQPLPEITAKQFYFIEIPRDATPEHVLDSLSKLRSGHQ